MVDFDRGPAEVTFDLAQPTDTAEAGDFEPFGAVYQAALATTVTAQPTAATLPSTYGRMLDSIGPRALGVGATAMYGGSTVASMAPPGYATTGAGTSIGQIGGYGRVTPPADLAAYGNGHIPAAALEPVGQGGHRLSAPAARAWKACVEAARADGIDLTITDSYRTYDQQVDLVQRKGLYSNGGFGATPGSSNHGWGLAVDADVTSPQTLNWLRANAWQFGFVEAVPREPWHWEFRPQQA
jgi:D-alanyl-D-alanine carboxypeptidase